MDRPVDILYDTAQIPGTTTVAGRRMRGRTKVCAYPPAGGLQKNPFIPSICTCVGDR